jgi:GT2 family glycosyltransferase
LKAGRLSAYPPVALMILNFNGLRWLRNCLSSVTKATYPNLDVYLVDNGSTDGSSEFVKSNYPNIKLITYPENLGFAEAYNRAVRSVTAKYVVLLNNDTIIDSDFVSELVEKAEADPKVGSVGCKIIQPETHRRYGPVFFTGNGLFMGPLFFGSAIGKDAVYSAYETTTECIANCGAAVLYRKSLVDAIGLFDSDFWSDMEDHDLGFRICITGYRNIYSPRTKVLHIGAASYGSVDSRTRVIRMTRNMLFTYVKNYEARNIILRFFPLMFAILPYRDVAVVLENEFGLLLRRDTVRRRKLRATYGASLAAYLQFLRRLSHMMKKRQLVQSFRKVSDEDVIRHTSKPLI